MNCFRSLVARGDMDTPVFEKSSATASAGQYLESGGPALAV
jgi:hypothetical protein